MHVVISDGQISNPILHVTSQIFKNKILILTSSANLKYLQIQIF